VAQLLGGHHGRFFTQPLRREVRHAGVRARWLGGGKWEEQRLAHLEAVAVVTGRPAAPPRLAATAAVLGGEVVVLADWLASQDHFVTAQLEQAGMGEGPVDVAGHWERALAAAPDLLAGAGLGLPEWKATPLS
jgi:CRISPR-associated endonuclease/helicase Cas3